MFCDSNNTDNITAINDRRETVERELRSDPTLSLSPSLRSHHHDVRTSTVSYLNTICFYLLFQSTPLPNSCCVVTVQGAHTLYKQLFTHLSYLKWSSISRAVMNPRIISQVAVKHCVFLSSGITTHQAENKKKLKNKTQKGPMQQELLILRCRTDKWFILCPHSIYVCILSCYSCFSSDKEMLILDYKPDFILICIWCEILICNVKLHQ